MEMHVVGIAGSLRKGSYNRALLHAAASVLPEGMTLEILEIRDVPLYDADLEAQGTPDAVTQLRTRIAAASALLIATPEYNSSIPGVLKNAIDWLSRGADSPLGGKPTAIMGASMGMMGTVRSQIHLRQVGLATNLLILNRPEVFVARAKEKFGADGTLTDEPTREQLRKLLLALRDWAIVHRRG